MQFYFSGKFLNPRNARFERYFYPRNQRQLRFQRVFNFENRAKLFFEQISFVERLVRFEQQRQFFLRGNAQKLRTPHRKKRGSCV